MLDQLMNDLRAMRRDVEEGGVLEVSLVRDTMSRVRTVAPGCTPAELGTLKDLVDDLMAKTRRAQADVSQRLEQIHGGRRALRGYAHLRGTGAGQKLFRRA